MTDVPYSREITIIVRDELQGVLDLGNAHYAEDAVTAFLQDRIEELEAALSEEDPT